jgi:hypothetical protein
VVAPVADVRAARAAGTVPVRKGDHGDGPCYLAGGEVSVPDVNVRVGPGQLFGETGILAAERPVTNRLLWSLAGREAMLRA